MNNNQKRLYHFNDLTCNQTRMKHELPRLNNESRAHTIRMISDECKVIPHEVTRRNVFFFFSVFI